MNQLMKQVAGIAVASMTILGMASAAQAVEVKEVVSEGGIRAWLIEDHMNPLMTMDIAFTGAGAATDPADKMGLANMVSGLIDEGAGAMDSQTFRGEMENRSISLSFDAGRDDFSGSLTTLTRERETAIDLLRLALSEPRFDDEAVERIRSQIVSGLKRAENDPGDIASRTFFKSIFGGHPYARPVSGNFETVAGLNANDFRNFVGQAFAKDNLIIGVAGDITAEELGPLLDEAFGSLPDHSDLPVIADVTPKFGGIDVVDQDIPQSQAIWGQKGIERKDPDFYPAYVMNYILGGGGFSSRLTEEVREKRGLAYGVYSYLANLDHAVMMMGGVATRNDAIGQSLSLVSAEWTKMKEKGVSQEELDNAKSYLTGAYPLRFTSLGNLSGMLVGMQKDDLGMDFLDRRNSLVDAVTLDDVNRVAAELMDPANVTVTVVGKPEGKLAF
ncbi:MULTISPECIES: M16 family metallopeptidase [Thalassospira]|uniref:Zinc protease n=2 Tax=Thalassospira TaxID=168934 RepID=A0A367WBR8_9PROT|nr:MULTISPECIES: pitrilysin family protein [Thalassospira]MDG4717653.1 pitrilysin family protein [Thalassospira sp. FZY0004]RCK38886.1 zinc protease [Thalassospira profundimaris]